MSKPKSFLKAAFAAAVAGTALAGCAVVPVGPAPCTPYQPCTYVQPGIVVAPVVPVIVVGHGRPGWHHWH